MRNTSNQAADYPRPAIRKFGWAGEKLGMTGSAGSAEYTACGWLDFEYLETTTQ